MSTTARACQNNEREGEQGYARVQSPFTATVELRNDFVIISCFRMKTLSPLAMPDRPWTAAIPVPAKPTPNQRTFIHGTSKRAYEPTSASQIMKGSRITRYLRSQITKHR